MDCLCLQAALKALTVLVGVQQLPGLPAAAGGAGKALSSLLRKVPDAGHPLAQDCFKLLGGMPHTAGPDSTRAGGIPNAAFVSAVVVLRTEFCGVHQLQGHCGRRGCSKA